LYGIDRVSRLPKRRVDGIFIADYEQGDIGQDLFRAACRLHLEGIVSKRLDRSYGAGRCNHWTRSRTLRIRRAAGFWTTYDSHQFTHIRVGEESACACLPQTL
jgi:hypothetical protein